MNDIREQLSAYLDGELGSEQARQVEQALREDPALAKELEALKAVREMVRSLPAQRAPEDFAGSVLGRAERMRLVETAALRRGRRLSWGSLVTAAIVLITVGAGIVVTVKLTLTPVWPERMANKMEARKLAEVPAEAQDRDRAPVQEPSAGPASRIAGERAEVAALPELRQRDLDVIRGSGEISPGLAAGSLRLADEKSVSNAGITMLDRGVTEEPATAAVAEGGRAKLEATTAPGQKEQLESIGMMPAMAATPGPRADRAPGTLVQAGEPLYHGEHEMGASAPATAPYLPLYFPEVMETYAYRDDGTNAVRRAKQATATRPACVPPCGVTSQPASQPATQPASQPTSQPSAAHDEDD